MEAIHRVATSRGGLEQWIQDVCRQTPLPDDSLKYYVQEFQGMGFGANDNEAAEALRRKCTDFDGLMKDLYEGAFVRVVCGGGSRWTNIDRGKGIALANRSVVVVRVPKGEASKRERVGLSPGHWWRSALATTLRGRKRTGAGSTTSATPTARSSWDARCGALNSVTEWTDQSIGRVFLRR
jgi:hypothetical protein